MLLKSRASPNMLPFSLCNMKRLAILHMNRPLFSTTLLIPSYDFGKNVGLRTYQHPLVMQSVVTQYGSCYKPACCNTVNSREKVSTIYKQNVNFFLSVVRLLMKLGWEF